MNETYDIGSLKNDPVKLYDMAVCFLHFLDAHSPESNVELWDVLEKVNRSLWSNLPPVVKIDFLCED